MNRPASIFRVRAHNTAPDSENRIHDDRVAAAYGFRGGLVPGVTVYGYMVPAILEQFGHDWLERGAIRVKFVAPCYEGQIVVTGCDGATATAELEDATLCASATVTVNDAAGEDEPWTREVCPVHPLPDPEQRPVASSETIVPGKVLGTLRRTLEAHDDSAVPERLLHLANDILVQNFKMSPWIHTGSEVRHHRMPARDHEITVTGRILDCFERKGRRFAVAGLFLLQAEGSPEGEPVASIRHTFIYQL